MSLLKNYNKLKQEKVRRDHQLQDSDHEDQENTTQFTKDKGKQIRKMTGMPAPSRTSTGVSSPRNSRAGSRRNK